MKKLLFVSSLLTLLTLAFAVGFAGSVSAAPASETLPAIESLDVLLDEADPKGRVPRAVRRFLHRASHSLVRAVRSDCDCGDLPCATTALAERKVEILDRLPERCDEGCRDKAEKALDKLIERILKRVENAKCEPAGGEPVDP